MTNLRLISINLLLISLCILCFEVVATRISSVIFVNDYAFIILSLSVLGLSSGGVYAYYRVKPQTGKKFSKVISTAISLIGLSLLAFILAVTNAPFIENPIIYFFLLFLPFFFAGIFYAQVFKSFAVHSFKVYAADLTGAALGALAAIGAVSLLGPVTSVLILIILIFASALSFKTEAIQRNKLMAGYAVLFAAIPIVAIAVDEELLGTIPIGYFPEKDFHHVYPDLNVHSEIIDSRWSIFGRSDLVEHSHQDMVKHLFVDGAAGSQMYRFDSNIDNPDPTLRLLLQRFTDFVPFIFLEEHEKNSMLVIGPGGGKEILTGLLMGIDEITGVEINPDFVDLVKEYREFNGGIFTDFPNVNMHVQEGRQYVKRQTRPYDLLVMVLPSTQQVQNIENYALSENYLVTVEAVMDYFNILTPEGRMIITVYNVWELKRLILTAVEALERSGIDREIALNHFKIIEDEFTPTLVVKKKPYTRYDVAYRIDVMEQLPDHIPDISYMPYQMEDPARSSVNRLLADIRGGGTPLGTLIDRQPYDTSPCFDDSPYFYKIERGIPENFLWLLGGVILFNLSVIGLPYRHFTKTVKRGKRDRKPAVSLPLMLFILIGAGFMIVEVSLFQKLVLYLGSPTVALSILLSSLLIGMGTGSFFGNRISPGNHWKRLLIVTAAIVIAGSVVILFYPMLLHAMLRYDLVYRAGTAFILMIPFGFLLGIPFPSGIRLLEEMKLDQLVPWMYGVNGAMSVFGSVIAVIISMQLGFTAAFFAGLGMYGFLTVMLVYKTNKQV